MAGSVLSLSKPEVGAWPVSAGKAHDVQPRDPVTPRDALATITIAGTPRAIRLRRPWARKQSTLLAQGRLPMLAVARGESGADALIAGFYRSSDGLWSAPFAIARARAGDDPVLAQGRDGSLVCAFNMAGRAMLCASNDRGESWTAPVPLAIDGWPEGARITAPPVQDRDDSWLAAVELCGRAKSVILRTTDPANAWRIAAELPVGGEAPSLAAARDGRWVVVANERGGDDLRVAVSGDRGTTWSEWRKTGMRGQRPEVVELLDTLFIVTTDGKNGELHTAFAWDELTHFIKRRLACGYCLRTAGHKVLARGSGHDVAGEFNDVAQVPLTEAEIAAARQLVSRRVATSDEALAFKGDWQHSADRAGRESSDSKARVEIDFSGRAAFLVHDVLRDGRLVEVKIDGREYSPVDMKGTPRSNVSTGLAGDLSPGQHRIVLRALLPWRRARMVIRGLEVAE